MGGFERDSDVQQCTTGNKTSSGGLRCTHCHIVQIHNCTARVDRVSTYHETSDTKLAILTFLNQTNIHTIIILSPSLIWSGFCV